VFVTRNQRGQRMRGLDERPVAKAVSPVAMEALQ